MFKEERKSIIKKNKMKRCVQRDLGISFNEEVSGKEFDV